MIEKFKIITSGKQLDTIVYPHTIVELDVFSVEGHWKISMMGNKK